MNRATDEHRCAQIRKKRRLAERRARSAAAGSSHQGHKGHNVSQPYFCEPLCFLWSLCEEGSVAQECLYRRHFSICAHLCLSVASSLPRELHDLAPMKALYGRPSLKPESFKEAGEISRRLSFRMHTHDTEGRPRRVARTGPPMSDLSPINQQAYRAHYRRFANHAVRT
jgi:hypothetical protein